MTPRLLTRGEGKTEELSNVIGKRPALDSVDLEPMRRNSVLSAFSLRKLEENQEFNSWRQLEREEGGRMELGLLEM